MYAYNPPPDMPTQLEQGKDAAILIAEIMLAVGTLWLLFKNNRWR